MYVPGERFPYLELGILFFVSLTSAIPLTGLFPYVAFMVVDIGGARNIDEAGYISGYVASAFMFGRLLTSFFWGHISDKVGRKPVVIISCISIMIFSIVFGLSVNLWMALISRFLLGLMNPLNSISRTLSSEICRKQDQSKAMSLVTGAWSVGLVVGPAIGGYLSRPAEGFPDSVFQHPFFINFPYFLPNAITAFMALASLVMTCIFLPETYSSLQHSSEHETVKSAPPPSPFLADTIRVLLSNRKVLSTSLAYLSISWTSIVFDEVLPLWALSSSDKGGLEMTSKDIGTYSSVTGVPMLLTTFFLFPPLNAALGEVRCFRYAQFLATAFGLCTVVLCVLPLPFARHLPTSTLCFVFLVSIVKSLTVVAFTANFMLINESVDPSLRGSVNGLSVTVGGISKTLGPLFGASVYAWSINHRHRAPLNYLLVFVVQLALGVGTCLLPLEDVAVVQGRHHTAPLQEIEMLAQDARSARDCDGAAGLDSPPGSDVKSRECLGCQGENEEELKLVLRDTADDYEYDSGPSSETLKASSTNYLSDVVYTIKEALSASLSPSLASPRVESLKLEYSGLDTTDHGV